jgi:integrase
MLSTIVERHIALHHATGYLFQRQGNLLRDYARYAEARGEDVVRAATALEWASRVPSLTTRQGRLRVIRRFAWLMHAEDPRHQIPPAGAFGTRAPRRTPYIYTDKELRELVEAAGKVGPRGALRSKVYATLLGLIAATGMRISEALSLRQGDVTSAGLVIRETKFHKSRLVPLHATTQRALDAYLKVRAKVAGSDDAVFLSERGTALGYRSVNSVFLSIVRRLGIHPGPGQRGPRIHDLRHTFAVRSLEQCAGNRDAIARHMLALATYLGHAHFLDTYWYLQATPSLLSDVATRCEALAEGGAR